MDDISHYFFMFFISFGVLAVAVRVFYSALAPWHKLVKIISYRDGTYQVKALEGDDYGAMYFDRGPRHLSYENADAYRNNLIAERLKLYNAHREL
jgi:hypothetical protein